jgi:hypothetical protein
MSKMREPQNTPGLSADALVSANVWHPPSFVRSLQLVIHRIWTSGDGLAPGAKKKLIADPHRELERLKSLSYVAD